MKKILVYGLSNTWGGVENIVLSIIKRMPNNFFFVIILPEGECLYSNKLGLNNIQIVNTIAWGKNPFLFAKNIKRLCKQESFSYVWMNVCNLSNVTFLSIIKKYSSAQILLHAHGSSFEEKSKLKSFLIRKLHFYGQKKYLDQVNFFCACSQKAAKWLYGDKKVHIKIINNGIDADLFDYNEKLRLKYRDDLDINSKVVFLSIGRLCEVKNQSFSLDVFKKIHDCYANSHLLIVGDGELGSELKQKCDSLALSSNVSFLGFRDDVNCILQAADILLIPSLHEGLPLVLIEAQCSGLLCIASDGVPEEACKTKMLHFLSLKSGANFWANYILNLLPYERIGYRDEIEKAHFNIRYSVEEMKNIFNM